MDDKTKEMAPEQKPEEEKKDTARDLPDEELKDVSGGGVPVIEPYRR